MEAQGNQPIAVYVRKGPEKDTRLISFRGPDANRFQDEALNSGFAIDGNSVSVLLTKGSRVIYNSEYDASSSWKRAVVDTGSDERDITQVLHEVEVMIRDWLTEYNSPAVFI